MFSLKFRLAHIVVENILKDKYRFSKKYLTLRVQNKNQKEKI